MPNICVNVSGDLVLRLRLAAGLDGVSKREACARALDAGLPPLSALADTLHALGTDTPTTGKEDQ